MTNLHNDKQPNFVTFLRDNCPCPNPPHPDLEQRIIDSLESRSNQEQLGEHRSIWYHSRTIVRNPRLAIARSTSAKLIATGFLFTSVSFGFKIPRVAVEPQELENFLVNNWQDTLDSYSYSNVESTEANWLIPVTDKRQKALSVSAP
ncbi:hypothetical protein NIES4102_26070 [Chondrocystis sp. NIES-4102]|nr:hypothetical protein NIES4102_26070 [Chondrocystis sp. NIES-4102]